jgi:heat shock protein HslJ
MRKLSILFICLFWISCGESNTNAKSVADPNPNKIPTLIKEKIDTALAGSWVLEALPQSDTPCAKLFPRQRPVLLIQPELKLLSGSTGCNRFSATLTTIGNRINLTDLTSSTLVCPGEAEASFMKALKSSTQYSFRNNEELVWGTDSVIWMVFRKK